MVHGRPAPRLTPGAIEWLERQQWPGNVRQLANLLERAVILDERSQIGAADLKGLLTISPEAEEREQLRQALRESDGDKKRAAEQLGISYRTLQRRIKQHDLEGYPHYRE